MPTQEWMCQGCGNMNGHGMTAIPSSCMRCGLSHTARAYPAYDPRTGKVVDAPSLAARSPAPSDEREGLAVLKVQTPTTGLNAVFGKMPSLPFPEDPAGFVDELLIADRLRAEATLTMEAES